MPRQYPLEPLFGRILSPFERFIQRTTAGGIVLVATTLLTLLVANSPWGAAYLHFWEQPLSVQFGELSIIDKSLHHWVNDGLMAFFFLLVGLELKREVLVGELSSMRDAALPIIAALGGMLVPAGIYLFFNYGGPGQSGWGIPMATDIAFAVGILVLLAWRVPTNLIVFLTALAIADDLGAVMIIALFYTDDLNLLALAASASVLALLALLNRGGIRQPLPYWLLGILLWYAVLASGVHATLAGILLALCIPARPARTPQQFDSRLVELQEAFHQEADAEHTIFGPLSNHRMATIAENVEHAASGVLSPLQRIEHGLSPWVTFLIIPIFAAANAGIDFGTVDLASSLSSPVTLGTALGLVLGKFLGISLFCWLGVSLKLGRLPRGVSWMHLLGAAWLGGIGFTMSLFIGDLAFDDPLLISQAKLGILLASAASAAVGLVWLYLSAKPEHEAR